MVHEVVVELGVELTDAERFFYRGPAGKIRARMGVSQYEEVKGDRTEIRGMHDLDARGFLVDVMSGAAHDDSPKGWAGPSRPTGLDRSVSSRTVRQAA